MPTYTYETIPTDESRETRRFDLTQRMSEQALSIDPETGESVRRIVTGGIALKFAGLKRSTVVNKRSAAATACGCATGQPHKHHGHGHGSHRHKH